MCNEKYTHGADHSDTHESQWKSLLSHIYLHKSNQGSKQTEGDEGQWTADA